MAQIPKMQIVGPVLLRWPDEERSPTFLDVTVQGDLSVAGVTTLGNLTVSGDLTLGGSFQTDSILLGSDALAPDVVDGRIEYTEAEGFQLNIRGQRRAIVTISRLRAEQLYIPANSDVPVVVNSLPVYADSLVIGRAISLSSMGAITQRNHADSFYTIEVLWNAQVLLSFTTPPSEQLIDAGFNLNLDMICRTVGATGTMIAHGAFSVAGGFSTIEQGDELVIDTTVENTITTQVTCNEANANTGPVRVEQGEVKVLSIPTTPVVP